MLQRTVCMVLLDENKKERKKEFTAFKTSVKDKMSFVWFPTVVWWDNSKLVNIANNWIFCAV
jgi:hypothetical protein